MFDMIWILLLVFLFWGEPDLWDKLHDRAMQYMETTQCQ